MVMREIQILLQEGRKPSELIELGFARSTVYVLRRQLSDNLKEISRKHNPIDPDKDALPSDSRDADFKSITGELHFQILKRLIQMDNALMTLFSRAFSSSAISFQEFQILALLVDYPAWLKQRDIAYWLCLSPNTISAHLDELERKRLANRRRDKSDGRAYIVVLTPEGASAFSQASSIVAKLLNQVFGKLSSKQGRYLKEVFENVIEGTHKATVT